MANKNDLISLDGDIQEALNAKVLRGDNGHFGMLWNNVAFTPAEGITWALAGFANSFCFYLLYSYAQARHYMPVSNEQLLVNVAFMFFIYGGCTFLFWNTVRNHIGVCTSLIAALLTSLGFRAKDVNEDRMSSVTGEWIKLAILWVMIIPGAFAGIYATSVFVPASYVATWNYGQPHIGNLTYLNPSDPLNTPLANESLVGYTLELLASLVIFFATLWSDGHVSIAKNRFVGSAVMGTAGALAYLIAGPFTGAPVSLLIWCVHAIRLLSTNNFILYGLSVLTGFGITVVVLVGLYLVNRFTADDEMYDRVDARIGTRVGTHLSGFKGIKAV